VPLDNGPTYVPEPHGTTAYPDASQYRAADLRSAGAGANGYGWNETDVAGYQAETAVKPRPAKRNVGRGLPGFAALAVLLLIAGVGGLIDQISGASIRGAFNWSLILGSLVGILIVRRTQMFTIVVAPPLVYFVASGVKLYLSSNGLKDRAALTDAAANWLVYGFPAIAAATAIVLVIAGIRMITRR
jgi:hypothetical protein